MGKITPLHPCAIEVENGVEDLADIDLAGTTGVGGLEQVN
jgi:hypothetical protein